jgi:Transposase DDE domain
MWVLDDRSARTNLHNLAEIHDGDPMADSFDHRDVVRDEQEGEVQFSLQPHQQIDDACLHRNVERRDRLIGDDQLGRERERSGYGDALSLAAGKLMRQTRRHVRAHGRTFSRSEFTFDTERDLYVCPGGMELRKYRRAFSTPREGIAKDGAIRYRAAQHDCGACTLKPGCCPNMLARKIARSVPEAARDKARAIAKTEAYAISCRERKKVEMLFAHLKRILRLGRLRLRGPRRAKDEFLLAATAQNLRKLAKLIPFPEPSFAL